MIISTPTRKEMQEIKTDIQKKFPCTDKGPISHFLNIQFTRNRDKRTIELSQARKIEKLLNDHQLDAADLKTIRKPRKTPACSNTKLTQQMCPQTDEEKTAMSRKPYRSILGQVLYIAITTRPDIATAASTCGKFAQNPGKAHWNALLRILSYLQGTQHLDLQLGSARKDIILTAYSDADWAGDLDNRKSRSGYVILCNNSVFIWSSKLQVCVALSSTEAEYIALSNAIRDIVWSRNMVNELGFFQDEPTVIFEDNASTIKIAESRKQLPGVKHIDIRHHFIRDRIASKEVILQHKSTTEMMADVFTKQLPTQLFERHRNSLRVVKRKGTFNH